MDFRECPRCGCPYNRKGNRYCVDCHARLPWLFRRAYVPPAAAPVVPPAPPAQPALPPPDLRVPFGPRQGEPISPTGIGMRSQSWRTTVAEVGAVVVAVLAIAVAILVAVLQHQPR